MVKKNAYIPQQGDIVWITFDPTHGHEQRGRRPAFVVTAHSYNELTEIAVVCPITSAVKNYPFEVLVDLPSGECAILVDQIRTIDWHARNAEYLRRSPSRVTNEVSTLLRTLLKL